MILPQEKGLRKWKILTFYAMYCMVQLFWESRNVIYKWF